MADEPSRKKRGGSDLNQDNWNKDDDDDEEGGGDGPFKTAAPEELAKRKFVKARRSTSGAVPDGVAETAPQPAATNKPFAWGAAPVAAGEAPYARRSRVGVWGRALEVGSCCS